MKDSSARPPRFGFTLVEILVVIVIIGILAGLAIPAVNGAIIKARNTATKVEIDILEQALETYKLNYGDYPPDFSDWRKVERHYRRAFPEIDNEELKILAQFCWLDQNYDRVAPVVAGGNTNSVDPRTQPGTYSYYRPCMDPAEALVWSLGGFSTDAKRPFTGNGGPLSRRSNFANTTLDACYNHFQYNSARDNSLFDFELDGLTLVVANDGSSTFDPIGDGTPYTYSDDENSGNTIGNNNSVRGRATSRTGAVGFSAVRFLYDPFPVYVRGSDTLPLVYFNADTYQQTFLPPTGSAGWPVLHNLNLYLNPTEDIEGGVARPYFSDRLDTNAGGLQWEQSGKYQIIAAGLDNSYGGAAAAGTVDPTDNSTAANAGFTYAYPSGSPANGFGVKSGGGLDKYEFPGGNSPYGSVNPQLDNITSFSNLLLGDDLE